jgi:TRAP-type uncharacterized transport system substrate-binding protein
MKRRLVLALTSLVLVLVAAATAFSGCTSGGTTTPTGEWKWPDVVYVTAQGQSGMAKYVSWTSIMEADTGMSIRVIPESSALKEVQNLKSGKMFLGSGSKSAMRNQIEALEDYAMRDAGPYMFGAAWVHDLAHSAFFVRGDSAIKTIYDIKPGTKFGVWDMKESTLNPTKSLLAWLQIDPKDVVFVNAGSYDGTMRAVAEGRADVAFCFPVSPAVFEASSAPQGIRFLDLNSDKDPAGAKRWQAVNRLYSFGPMAGVVQPAIGRWGTVGYIFEITSLETNPELIYRTAKWLDENYDKYKDKYASNVFMTRNQLMEAIKSTYYPIHPGLIRYLKEKGLWTADHERRNKANLDKLTLYVNAFQDAIKLADQKGIKVDPTNQSWIDLWTNYKVEHKIPYIVMHPSLTEDGPVILYVPPGMEPTPGGAAPAPAPSPAPTPSPTPTASAPSTPVVTGNVKLQLVSVTSPVQAGDEIKIVLKTEPATECDIKIWFSTGQLSNLLKGAKTADAGGNIVWTWTLTRNNYPGDTPFEITAKLGDKSGTLKSSFIILKNP